MGTGKSKNMKDKPKFDETFLRLPITTQNIFNELKDKSIEATKASNWGYSDKPDFRIGIENDINIIEFVLRSKYIRVILRVDRQSPDEKATQLNIPLRETYKHKTNARSVEFTVSTEDQVPNAVELIKEVYNRRKESGF